MTDDETVDGPRVAAQILNKMSPDKKNRLLKSIHSKSPEIFAKIEDNIFTFEDIAEITDQGLQALVKEIAHKDLVLALKVAPEKVTRALIKNMSKRKSTIIIEDLQALPLPPESEVSDAKKRILATVEKLRAAGALRTQKSDGIWV